MSGLPPSPPRHWFTNTPQQILSNYSPTHRCKLLILRIFIHGVGSVLGHRIDETWSVPEVHILDSPATDQKSIHWQVMAKLASLSLPPDLMVSFQFPEYAQGRPTTQAFPSNDPRIPGALILPITVTASASASYTDLPLPQPRFEWRWISMANIVNGTCPIPPRPGVQQLGSEDVRAALERFQNYNKAAVAPSIPPVHLPTVFHNVLSATLQFAQGRGAIGNGRIGIIDREDDQDWMVGLFPCEEEEVEKPCLIKTADGLLFRMIGGWSSSSMKRKEQPVNCHGFFEDNGRLRIVDGRRRTQDWEVIDGEDEAAVRRLMA